MCLQERERERDRLVFSRSIGFPVFSQIGDQPNSYLVVDLQIVLAQNAAWLLLDVRVRNVERLETGSSES